MNFYKDNFEHKLMKKLFSVNEIIKKNEKNIAFKLLIIQII